MATLHLSCCRIDLERRIVRRREGTLRLTSTEAALLAYLTAHAGKPVPRGELLREVWGYAEGVASRSVDTAVRRLRAKIEIDKHHPAHLLSEHGVGYRFVVFGPEATGGSVVPIARSVEETVPPPRWRPRALPGELGPLIGRGRDLARLRDHVQAGVRLVTVTGPAGVGKTRLALRVALEERDRSEQDATFVDLSAARDAAAVVSGVAAALRYDLSTAADPAERLGKWLSLAPPALLVLDNLEQLPPDAIQVVGDLLRSASALRVLATSRAPTGLPGEVVVGLDPLSPSDGAQLLFDRAKAAGCPASLRGTPAERQELSTLLDGLPLAIELAAPRLRLFGRQRGQCLFNATPVLSLLNHLIGAFQRMGRKALVTQNLANEIANDRLIFDHQNESFMLSVYCHFRHIHSNFSHCLPGRPCPGLGYCPYCELRERRKFHPVMTFGRNGCNRGVRTRRTGFSCGHKKTRRKGGFFG